MTICSHQDCERPVKAKSLCLMHYKRKRNGWRMDARPHRFTDQEAGFWSMVDRGADDECWLWSGTVQNGYGQFLGLAHRWSYSHFVAPLSDGEIVRHTCDQQLCVNPAHLLVGSQSDNVADRVARDRSARGEQVHLAKLTEDEVQEIRSRRADGESVQSLASRFSVSRQTVRDICAGRTWTHLGDGHRARRK